MNRYKFDEKRHIHTLDDKPLIGVTTALSVISKPALIQWAANQVCEYVQENLRDLTDLGQVLGDAKYAHRRKKEKAGDVGTEAHKWIENWVLARMGKGEYPTLPENKVVQNMVKNFTGWAVGENINFLESEKNVWSEKLWIGGILDLVFEMNGKKFIGDIKTSSGIYNEHFFQMAAYELCLEEMGVKDIDGYLVINLKKDGTMDLKMGENREINKRAFLSALELHKIIKNLT